MMASRRNFEETKGVMPITSCNSLRTNDGLVLEFDIVLRRRSVTNLALYLLFAVNFKDENIAVVCECFQSAFRSIIVRI